MGNLSFDVTREELIEAFSAAGKVVDAKVPTDRETGRPRGFAFVEFENDDGARRCIEQLNGRDLKGRPLRVNEAENRPPRPPGAPGGPGGGGFSRPGGGPGGFSRPGGGGGASRGRAAADRAASPGRAGRAASGAGRSPRLFEEGDSRGRRFRQKPEQKPARKTSPRRRRDDIVEDDDEKY